MGQYFDNENLPSKMVKTECFVLGSKFIFYTDNGVFSKGELDFGTELLIKNVISENINGSVLDLGCGYGPVGIILNKKLKVPVDMIDINKRAIHLSKLNIKSNDCTNINAILSDGYEVINKKYDYIISNPPIRVGKNKLYELIRDSKKYLNTDGKIYLVMRKEQGAKTFIKDFSNDFNIKILDKKKGFYIILLKS